MDDLYKQVKTKSVGALFVIALLMVLTLSTLAAAQETSGNFQGGSIKIGYDNRACNSSLAGSIRFNSGTNLVEVCGGVSWTAWGS